MEPAKRTSQRSLGQVSSVLAREGVYDHHDTPSYHAYHQNNSDEAGIHITEEQSDADRSEHSALTGAPAEDANFTNLGYNPFTPQSHPRQALSTTFMHMQYRKLKRSSSGSYRDNPRGSVWGIMYGGIFSGFLAYYLFLMASSQDWVSLDMWKVVVFELLLTLVLGYLSSHLLTLTHSLTLFYLFLLVTLYILLLDQVVIFRYVALALIIVMILTWTSHFVYWYIGPMVLRKSRYCFGWRRVKSRKVSYDEESGEPGSMREVVFEYQPLVHYCTCSSPNTFVYRGEWKNNRPSGWGEWRDDSFYGESLVGWWEDGIPQGPFGSVERGTGNMFACVAVGYCSMRGTVWKCQPFSEMVDSLTYGMSYVEAAISGGFYLNFPSHTEVMSLRHTIHGGPDEGVARILPAMNRSEQTQSMDSVVVSVTSDGLEIYGYEPTSEESRRTATINLQPEEEEQVAPLQSVNASSPVTFRSASQQGSLNIMGWQPSTQPEILIFIHGYNIPLDSASRKLGQLMAAGRFPPHIKPFIFSWPTGKVLFYPQSIKVAVDDTTMKCFQQFLESIIAAGVHRVHIFTHSCGVKIFMRALQIPSIVKLFEPLQRSGDQNQASGRLHMLTTTMANADYSIRDFRDTEYHVLRGLCKHISLYVDKFDGALKYSAIWTRRLLLGRLSAPLYTTPEARELLDVDIMDTSGLQDNMDTVRHSAFTVNRVMVEDLREIIVSRKRARDRSSRLVNKKGNFYCFMTTPAAVTGNDVV